MKSALCVILAAIALFASSATPSMANAAQQKAAPYLIVPGFSMGKVRLGQKREDVWRAMGPPAKSEFRSYGTVIFDSRFNAMRDEHWKTKPKEPFKTRRPVGRLSVDVWLRPPSPGDKMQNRRDGWPNTFEVLYRAGRVVQVSTTLGGYKTRGGLSVDSAMQEFEDRCGAFDSTSFDYDGDRPAGSSHAMKTFLDFARRGLVVESDTFSDGDDLVPAFSLSIHQPGEPHLFEFPAAAEQLG